MGWQRAPGGRYRNLRSRAEARTAYREGDEDDEEVPVYSRFTTWDTTSGLPDDSREADERAAERRLRDLRGRVKAARAARARAAGKLDAMRTDWRREAGFLAHFGITQAQFRNGVAAPEGSAESVRPVEVETSFIELGERRRADLPG
jgi:hypothetical protein